MAMGEQQQMFGQALQGYGTNVQAQQQQLGNLLAGYQGAFGTLSNLLGIEQNLIGQAAGLEEARARAASGAYAPVAGQQGMLSSFAQGVGSSIKLSDVRLKDNITELGKIGNINFYFWDWSDKAIEMGAGNNPTVGVMAQEILNTMPDAVIMAEDGYYRVDYSKVFNEVLSNG
jgi:hypothetical protein